MIWKRRFLQHRTAALAGAALTAGLGALALVLPLGLDRLSYDLLFAFRPAVEVEEVVIVGLDERSHQELRQPDRGPWDRSLYGQVLTNLARWGARAVALDVEFDDNGALTPADRCLAEGLRHHGRVVLGASWGEGHYLRSADTMRLKLPDPDLILSETNWGTTVVVQDPDGAVRRHYHGIPDIPTLSWRLATALGLEATRPPGAQARERWLSYYGAPGAVPRVRFALVHQGTEPGLSNVFAGKVVFIGAGVQTGYTGSQKEGFRHPLTWLEGTFVPGVEVHATQFLNLLRADWLRRPGPWLELFGMLMAGLLLGPGLALLRPMRAVAAGVVVAAATLAAASALAWAQQVWFAWAVVALVEIPVAMVCTLAFRARGATEVERRGETAEFTPAGNLEAAPRIPDYELLRRIGSGSYGDVWLARSVTGQWRAVKVVHRRAFGQDRQFEREFEGVRQFEPVSRRHEGLVQVLHVGRNDAEGLFFYVMEAADEAVGAGEGVGERGSGAGARTATEAATKSPTRAFSAAGYAPHTLKAELQQRGRIPAVECADIGAALAGALEFLHEQRLVHRDIKPSNIIFVDGRAKLADVGLVAGMDEARSFVGTEGFIPPEGPGTPSADVFSLGRVLYEMFTGCEARQFPEFRSPAGIAGVEELEAVIRRACHSEMRERHPTAAALRADLERLGERLRGGATTLARQLPPGGSSQR